MFYIRNKVILKSFRIYKQESSREYNTRLFINHDNYRRGEQDTSNKATKTYHGKRAERFDYILFFSFFLCTTLYVFNCDRLNSESKFQVFSLDCHKIIVAPFSLQSM